MLICVGKETCEIEVFVEHDILAHSEPPLYLGTPNSRHEDVQEGEDEDFSSEEEVDRPLEDEEPDQSEDEMNESVAEEKNEHVTEKENEPVADGNDDNGDDVVQDVGDGGDDGIFKAVFEEGSMAKIDKEAYKNFEEKKEEAKRESEESEEEGVIEEDADYPDTPLESDEEWKQWDKEKEKRDGKRKSNIKSVYEVNEFESDDNPDDPIRYVAEYYYTDVLKRTYEENIKPVNGDKFCKKTHKPPISIPEFCKPRGRPRTRDRRKEPFEDLQNAGKATRHGRVPHCSRCKQAGHIFRGCKNEPVIQPKLPPKPRGRKKTPATTGSSQPIQSTATAEADVSCSAPQPFVSTNRLKAHVKKAPRGPPLKIRKTGNIPHGVGKFWSPFTDRPFEVFGD
ncbi:hypothetical protein F2Q68_00027128 [Brassica cretica]|uniref:CCHC-type domain-containing protein n=1 Tax=Brassica cretica TaxID=69181 RepID=A0A8S9IFP3_BRACR|nr:hypothetical protein F2Q68_00027128 [Brassica cretica]